MKDLNKLIDNIERDLMEIQKYFNAQPKEDMPGYDGTCSNYKALDIYRSFPSKKVSMVNLNTEELIQFIVDFYSMEFGDIRLGQAFCNKYKISNPSLFYEQDVDKAMKIIYEEYNNDSPTETEIIYAIKHGLI